jgi:hypothetical protein
MRAISITACWLLAGAACLVAGCGETKAKSVAELDASELLALIQGEQPGEARNLVEADLGRFRISHSVTDGQVLVQFHLIGLISPQKQTHLAELLPRYDKRLRDAVISLVQRMETDHLLDPSLAFFKTEIVAAVNRVLQEQVLRDVAFSDFSLDQAATPWSAPEGAAKPKEGGHGH